MLNLKLPDQYDTGMSIRETEVAIKLIKDFFERELSEALALTRVSAPLFVSPDSGLNDNLNGIERPVTFGIKELDDAPVEIVHSLAKWKRMALKRYGFCKGEGLYTDMNAIRRDEDTDNLHSIYVDQWDWEKIIGKEERTIDTLKTVVNQIYEVLKRTEMYVASFYPQIKPVLPKHITFVTTAELETALELSSMGIRVDAKALKAQLEIAGCMERAELPFQKALLNNELPDTIGGGIGQSRICMFFLRRAHIGEVQASIWPEETIRLCEEHNIHLL